MSTKSPIKGRQRTAVQPGFELYGDCIEEMFLDAGDPEPPVYLCLDGLPTELETLPSGGARVTVTIPREMAREMGLLPAEKT